MLSYKEEQELIWEGKRFAKFLLAGKHYYKLEKIDKNSTEFLHGEYFTGWFSHFIPKSLLKKMENTFIEHNQKLKEIVKIDNKALIYRVTGLIFHQSF